MMTPGRMSPDMLKLLAIDLVSRSRYDADDILRHWMHRHVPDPRDREAMLFLLARALPEDTPTSTLLGLDPPPGRQRRPHGTPARYRWHQAQGQRFSVCRKLGEEHCPCHPCHLAGLHDERERKRRLRKAREEWDRDTWRGRGD